LGLGGGRVMRASSPLVANAKLVSRILVCPCESPPAKLIFGLYGRVN
jgi:hypothetical protein